MHRKWMWIGLALLVGLLGWWVLRVTLLAGSGRTDASGYGQFVLAAVGLPLAVLAVIWARPGHSARSLDEVADAVAVASRVQWTAAAADRGLLHPQPLPIRWRRSHLPVTGPVSATTTLGAGGFDPLPGLSRVTAAQLRQGTHRTLHRLYGGLASGRLIIAGAAGAGKTSAAILLLLDALNFRDSTPIDQRARIPVPVLFTLTGWDPATTIHAWLTSKLTELAPLSGRYGRQDAADLLSAGRIAVIFDGLDEIPEPQRPTVLRALADQATFRLVLLTRTHELAIATKQRILTGAACIELQTLTPTDATTYLRNCLPDPPSPGWQHLLDTLTATPTALSAALTNPLTITLLRDTYHPPPPPDSPLGPPGELLDTSRFPTAETITHHLLDHAITTAYTPKPGQPPPPYTPDIARHALTVIAQHLCRHNTRDLHWWSIPTWVPTTPRTLLTTTTSIFVVGLTFAVAGWLTGWVEDGLVGALGFGLAIGLIVGLMSIRLGQLPGIPAPRQLGRFKLRGIDWRGNLARGLVLGFMGSMVGVGIGYKDGLMAAFTIGVTSALVVGLVVVLALTLRDGLTKQDVQKVINPRAQLRGNLAYALACGVATALVVGLVFGLAFRPAMGIALGLPMGLTTAFMATNARLVAISQLYLARKHHIPLRLLKFLADAHQRHLLRTVGATYQFRHATLQDRLAPVPQHE